MKKMFIATCLLAASVFAAPQAAAKAPAAAAKTETAAPAAKADAKAAPAAKAEAPKADAKAAPAAKAEAPKADAKAAPAAKAEAPKADAKAAPAAKAEAPKADAKAAPAAKAEAPKADAKAEAAAPAVAPAADTTKKAEAPKADAKAEAAVAPADSAAPAAEAAAAPADSAAPAAEAAAAPADSTAPAAEAAVAPADSTAPAAEAAVAPADSAAAPAAEVAAAEPVKKAKKKRRKKQKMIEKPVVETKSLAFDIQADFELEAGKVFWSSEDDEMGDNLETWSGEANFAVLAEGENFKGKIGVAFYPGDLRMSDNGLTKVEKKTALREGTAETTEDYFSLDEAWAMQNTDNFVFKVGRWDNTDKNGDYFGGYVDGYLNGFMSTQDPENQLQFGFTPNDNLDFFLSFISGSPNLNKGDVRAAFNFHGLESINDLNIQLAYRSNLFDKVYDADVDVAHNVSLKAKLPLIKNFLTIFAEGALMNIDPNDDMVFPITGGVSIETKVVDRIILEAEWVKDRQDFEDFQSFGAKHVKDVLGALYLEKAFTDRFSLSAGFHSYGCTRDFMLSGNLVGRIN
ncbi:MAG: hypothetical protein MJY82_10975 [Fibrobacter sp.]|nr:hypothetical protein [Fibrobacter sp.]